MSSHTKNYIRFIILRNHKDSGVAAGFFVAAYELKRSNHIFAHDLDQLNKLLVWFEGNLEVPKRFNKSKSKGHYRRATKGISWFKPEASSHISKARLISNILSDYGIICKKLTTSRPGYVVFEDAHQIVAEPFADTVVK